MKDENWMREAILEAQRAGALREVPVGAVIICGDRVLARASNRRESEGDPLAHAEIVAIRRAAQVLGNWRLEGCTIYVTLEPCAMCAGALVLARMKRLVYGATDPKAGFCGSLGNIVCDPRLNHRLEVVGGVLEQPCSFLLKHFFATLRRKE